MRLHPRYDDGVSFLAILFALLFEQVRPLAPKNVAYATARAWARLARKNLDAGREPHGWLTWSAVVLLPGAMVCALHWSLLAVGGWVGVALVFVLHVAVLYLTLGFRQFSYHFTTIRDALGAGDEATARAELAAWRQTDTSQLSTEQLLRQVIEHSVLSAHRHVFGVLGWYAVLCALGLGPAGALLYRMSVFANQYYHRIHGYFPQTTGLPVSASLLHAVKKAWYVMDYVPARATAMGFAIVGNFEEAVESWRNFSDSMLHTGAGADLNENDGIILAATSGAVNVRLGGESETAQEPKVAHLRSIVGLVWRSVVLWVLLLALLSLARLLG